MQLKTHRLQAYAPDLPLRRRSGAMLYIKDGIVNSGTIIATLFVAGGLTGVVLATKSIDNLVDYSIYRLQDKGLDVLIPLLTLVFLLFGTFSGGDCVIAMVPIGLMIARKLRASCSLNLPVKLP